MKAIIIGQNHSITTYQINGKRRYIIEDIPRTVNRQIVNGAIEECNSRDWAVVTNLLDEQGFLNGSGIEKTIESMTY